MRGAATLIHSPSEATLSASQKPPQISPKRFASGQGRRGSIGSGCSCRPCTAPKGFKSPHGVRREQRWRDRKSHSDAALKPAGSARWMAPRIAAGASARVSWAQFRNDVAYLQRWTSRGARLVLKHRAAALTSNRWNAFWRKISLYGVKIEADCAA